jgi:hypothetical protein
MQNHLSERRFWLVASLLLTDLLFFSLSDPSKVPSFMLMIGFLLMVATIYLAVSAGFRLARLYGLVKSPEKTRVARLVTLVIAAAMALQSTGELGLKDVVVILPLAGLALVYLSYRRSPPARSKIDS